MMVMVRSSKLSILFMLVSLFFFVSSWAKNAAPAPAAVDCSSLVLNMADCLSYVTGDGTVRTPEDTCCSGLKMVLKTDAECLCEAFRNSAQLGVTLNITKALALPSACRVSAPSVTNCGLDIATGAAPVATFSPLATSPSSTADAPAPSIIGANDVASVSGSASSRSSALAASVELLVTFLAVVSFSFF